VKLRAGLGIGLVAACALALQVLLSRVLSAVLAYRFSFLAISLALLGVGAGALVVHLRPAWGEPPAQPRLARWCALVVRTYVRWIGRIYACDLAGAALGALAAVPLMWVVPGTTLLVRLSASTAHNPATAAVVAARERSGGEPAGRDSRRAGPAGMRRTYGCVH
jgi:hypothetical protein